MVNIRSELPRLEDGQPNVDAWLMNLAHSEDLDCERLARAAALCRGHARILEFGVDLAQLSRELQLDSDSLAAALVYPALGAGIVDFDTVRANIGDAATELVANVIKLTPVGAFELSTSPLLASESADQVDNVQNMLVSMIDDPRVAVMKLAERVVALRLVKNESESLQRQMAEEAQSVFAPLANRLGIWQVKWGTRRPRIPVPASGRLQVDRFLARWSARRTRTVCRQTRGRRLVAPRQRGFQRGGARPSKAHLQHMAEDA